ncbi:Alpha/Beta hydrolase protein [Podospora australis]|uniref:Alpha/Beta hydrolase protein n=1 Tax=Podospora australis TaxID=1536484 RepID=A0AAN7AH50_9PEZI|nr:Alpha/Beta hydrolase protein [Podospora australis]
MKSQSRVPSSLRQASTAIARAAFASAAGQPNISLRDNAATTASRRRLLSTANPSLTRIHPAPGSKRPAPARPQQQSLPITTRRYLHAQTARRSGAPSNPAMKFPCVDALETRSATLRKQATSRSDESGPEPSYTAGATQTFHSKDPILLDHGGQLVEFDIAYETWGEMNADRSNVILLHTGLSASSHAHSTLANPQPGWWEKFIGPGLALDTNKYHVICTNVVGGCYGSTGPSSIDPSDGKRYATRFPILTIQDMVRCQFRLLDHLGVETLHASVGSSMGGMQSLAAGVLFPDRVSRIVSISACARSHPYSIAMRYVQRKAILTDPNWNRGYYYDDVPPHMGMKLAREIATITYRSGPEWEQRFGRRRADSSKPPALCPDFLVETYLDHAGEKFCLTYDPNSLIYVSKAMDLFDLGRDNQVATATRRAERAVQLEEGSLLPTQDLSSCSLTLPDQPYEETENGDGAAALEEERLDGSVPHRQKQAAATATQGSNPPADLVAGLAVLKKHPVLVMGVASDILFPAWQQREVAEALRQAGNRGVEHLELTEEQSLFGHDTFLLDVKNVGGTVKDFLS